MREAVEEFGTAIICCVIGIIVITGLSLLITKGGALSTFAEAYATYFYGEAI